MASGKTSSKAEPIFKVVRFSGAAYSNLASGGGKAYTAENVGYSVPDGYEQFGIRGFNTGSMHVTMAQYYPEEDTDRFMTIRNADTSARGGTPYVDVTFINKKYKETGTLRKLTVLASPNSIEMDFDEYIKPGEIVTITVSNPNASWQYDWYVPGQSLVSKKWQTGTTITFEMPDSDVAVEVYGGVPHQLNCSYTSSSGKEATFTVYPESSVGYAEGAKIQILADPNYSIYSALPATLNGNAVTGTFNLYDTIYNITMPSVDSSFVVTLA